MLTIPLVLLFPLLVAAAARSEYTLAVSLLTVAATESYTTMCYVASTNLLIMNLLVSLISSFFLAVS